VPPARLVGSGRPVVGDGGRRPGGQAPPAHAGAITTAAGSLGREIETREARPDVTRNGIRSDEPESGRLHALLDAPPALLDAVGSLVEQGIGRILSAPHAVTSAAEGKRLLTLQSEKPCLASGEVNVKVNPLITTRHCASSSRPVLHDLHPGDLISGL